MRRLLDKPEAHIAYIPVENPDGYALHGRLCEGQNRRKSPVSQSGRRQSTLRVTGFTVVPAAGD